MADRGKGTRKNAQTVSPATATKIRKRKEARLKRDKKKGFVWVT